MENTICAFAALPHQGIDDWPLKKKNGIMGSNQLKEENESFKNECARYAA